MQLHGVHHVSINVSDLSGSAAFYADVLGLETLPRPDEDISVPGVWLGLPDGRELHLLAADTPEGKGQHFAFEVSSVDEVIAELAQHGISASDPGEIRGVCRQTFCTDPSGNLVEFNERLTT